MTPRAPYRELIEGLVAQAGKLIKAESIRGRRGKLTVRMDRCTYLGFKRLVCAMMDAGPEEHKHSVPVRSWHDETWDILGVPVVCDRGLTRGTILVGRGGKSRVIQETTK